MWGRQSCLQPPFRRLSPTRASAADQGVRPTKNLNFQNTDRLLEAFDRIAALRRRVFVRNVARETEFRNRFRNETVVQLLGIIELVAPGISARVEVADPLEV